MVTRNYQHRQWKYNIFMCVLLTCLSAAVTKENRGGKETKCSEEMKLEMNTSYKEALSKLTNPTEEEIKNIQTELESQFPESCLSENNFNEGFGPNKGIGTQDGIGGLGTKDGFGKQDDKVHTVSDDEVQSWMNETKIDPKEFYEFAKKLDVDTLKHTLKNITEDMNQPIITGLGEELLQKFGGVKKLKVADIQDLGLSVVYMIPPGEYKYVSNEVFKYILDQIYQATDKALKELANGTISDMNLPGVSAGFLVGEESSRIKALCGRAFRLYRNSKAINSDEGWKNIKFLMFCAPPRVCKSINNDLVQNAIDALAFQPWTCYDIRKLGQRDKEEVEHDDSFIRALTNAKRLFPSNKPCGKFLAGKLVSGGKSTLKIDSVEVLQRLQFLSACLPYRVLKKAIDDIGCSFGSELMMEGALSKSLEKYLAKKCAAPPKKVENVTCISLETDYKPYLQSMKRSFFKSLPQNVMCDAKCMDLFKEAEGFPKDVMKFIMKKCYKDNQNITGDDVKNLGSLVTDLPLDKFEQITPADLETNIKSIKKGLKGSKKQRGKKAILKKLAKKMLNGGQISDLVDSKEIMKEVSLKDLKTSLSASADVIKDLGIGDTNETLGFTASQKKWVVKQVVKNKEAGAFTVEDLREMKSLVTGLLSTHIKKMGEAHSNDSDGMDLAREMCTHTDWPRKSLEAINKHLIQNGLKVRNSTDPMSSLTVMDVEGLGCQCLLNLNSTEYEDMATEVCSAVCMKIGYCDIFRCLNPVSRKNVLQACLKCKGLGSKVITDADFDELGPNLISQMSQTQLDLVPAEVLQSHIEFFKDICMDQNLRTAVSTALQKVIGSSGADYESDTLYMLGSAIKVLPKSIQEKLNKTVIADMQTALMEEIVPQTDEEIKLSKCCEKWLNTTDFENLKEQNFNLMLTVKEAFFADTEVSRKKRSNIFKWTCHQIRPLPVLFVTASAKEIDIMNNKEFLDCLEIIGNIETFKRWQHHLLMNKTKIALSKSVCDMTVDELELLGVIALAFDVEDISCLPLSDNSLVASLGGLEGWNSQQLSALATAYMSTNSLSDLSTLTSDNITMLGPIMCGFTASQITTIPAAEFGKSGEEIGSLRECGLQQMDAFVSLAVQDNAYGPIRTWDSEDVSELKFIIAGLSGNEIEELPAAAFEGLDDEVIPIIPRDVFKSTNFFQLQSFSDAQASAVTNSQRVVLTAQQNAILDSILIPNPIMGAGSGHGHGDDSGANPGPAFRNVVGGFLLMFSVTMCIQRLDFI